MIKPPVKPLADFTPDEVKHLVPVCGPIYEDTPESVRVALQENEENEEQLAMFDSWLDAAIWLSGMLAVSLLIVVILVLLGISIYSRFHG